MNETDRRADEGLEKLGYKQEMKRVRSCHRERLDSCKADLPLSCAIQSRNVWHILFSTFLTPQLETHPHSYALANPLSVSWCVASSFG